MKAIATLVAIAAAASACSSNTREEPRRPPISRPLDASAYAGRVCDLLPADQATRLGYPTPGYQGDGSFCSRIPPDSPLLDIDLYLTEDRLARAYSTSDIKSIGGTNEPWLEPLTIGGQPAAALGRSHQRPNRSCEVVVGLTDTQSLRVHAGQHYRDPRGYNDGHGDGRACEHAIAVAEVVVKTLGG